MKPFLTILAALAFTFSVASSASYFDEEIWDADEVSEMEMLDAEEEDLFSIAVDCSVYVKPAACVSHRACKWDGKCVSR